MRALLVVVLLLAASAVAVSAGSAAPACDRRSPAVRGSAALERVRYPVGDLAYTIAFLGPRRGTLAVTFTAYDRIEVYVRACQSVDAVAAVLGHEVGHAIDDRVMTPARRGEYLAAREISGEWYGCNRCTDTRTPAGDYAEVAGSLFAPAGPWRSRMADRPTGAAAEALRPFFYPVPSPPAAPPPPVTTTTRPGRCAVAFGLCLVPA